MSPLRILAFRTMAVGRRVNVLRGVSAKLLLQDLMCGRCAEYTAALLITLLPPKEENVAGFSTGSDVGKCVLVLSLGCCVFLLQHDLLSSNTSLHIPSCFF